MFKDLSIQMLPILPAWLVILVTLGMLALVAWGSRHLLQKQVPAPWVKRLALLRVAIVLLLTLCLLQPVVSFPYTVTRPAELIVMIDASKSMGLPGAEGKGTRLDEVRSLLQEGAMGSRLRHGFTPHWFSFDRTAYPLDLADLPALEAAGDSTHFADSLRLAWSLTRPAAAGGASPANAPARVLLVSDGNDLGETDVVEFARQRGLIIDTLAPRASADTASAGNATIAQVQCASRILIGSETEFRVTVRKEAEGGAPLTLRVSEDGTDVLSRAVTFAPGQTEQQVSLAHRPTTVGLKKYHFHLDGSAPADAAPYAVSVSVADAKHQVLILEDTWRWEFKFLRRVLEDDPSFSFTALLSRGGGAFVHFGEHDRRVNLGGFPQGREELSAFDTMVLGDVDPQRWPRGLAPALARSVTEDGKSLIIVAGPSLPQLAEVSVLNALLPVELTRASGTPTEGPIEIRLTPEGARSAFFFAPGSAKEPSLFAQLPPLAQVYPALRKRPAATVLMEAAEQANDYGNLIVMAEHTVGRGRVLFVGTDTLWKWQTRAAVKDPKVTPYALFWQQAFRALAPARPGSGAARLWLQPEQSRYEAGQRVRVRAEVQSEPPLTLSALQASVVLPDERRLPLAFAPDPSDPKTFRAEFEASQPGQYRLAASLPHQGALAAEVSTTLDVASPRAELAGGRVDDANLARIAAATGGRKVDPADPTTWPSIGDLPPAQVREVRSADLWSNFSLLLILCGLLGTDWLLRLIRGYV